MAPGWYHAEGDPPGTQRYWDGELWQGEPRPVAPSGPPAGAPVGGYQVAHYPEGSQATTALVLSILGILVCQLLGPVGWVIANKELAAIDAGLRDPNQRGTAKAGQIVGIIATVIMVLAIVFLLFLLIAIPVFGA